jgi:hypothetical protein
VLNQHIQTLLRQNFVIPNDYEANYGTPDYTITSFPSTGTGVDNSVDVLIAIDANISSTDTGIILDLGGDAVGLAVGVDSGTLRVRAYQGYPAFPGDSNGAGVEANISSYTGSDATYYFTVDHSARTLTAYVQPGGQGSSNSLVNLGSDTATTVSSFGDYSYRSNSKGYGQVSSTVAALGYTTSFSGTIDEIRYWAESTSLDISSFGSSGPTQAAGFAIGIAVTSPSFVGSVSGGAVSTVSLSSITGLTQDDVVLVLSTDDNDGHSISSSGWTYLGTVGSGGVVDRHYAKTMGATPDTGVSLNRVVDSLSACAFRGVEYESASSGTSTSGSTITPQSITVTTDNSIVVVFAMIDDDPTSTISTAPTGYTTALVQGGTGNRQGSAQAVFYKTGVSAGTESPSAITWSTSDSLSVRTFLFKPTGPVQPAAAGFTL